MLLTGYCLRLCKHVDNECFCSSSYCKAAMRLATSERSGRASLWPEHVVGDDNMAAQRGDIPTTPNMVLHAVIRSAGYSQCRWSRSPYETDQRSGCSTSAVG
jgi:hypothetical protein